MTGQSDDEDSMILDGLFQSQYRRVTNGQTDRQREG